MSSYSSIDMSDPRLAFEDIFKDISPNERNEFGLKREMRFISERIIVEYDPSDHLSVREIMHPMDAFRSYEPYFKHKLVDKTKNQFVTAIDFHEHITYFPYAKNTGDICLARYISNFNDINFTKISGQDLCSLPGETIYGVRVGRLDKGMLAANHRTGSSVNSTVTVMDLVRPARNLAHYDSLTPVNTIDWVWHSPFLLAVGDDKSLRVMDVRCPKAYNAVFFEGGVKKTALCSSRPLEIACWNGSNVLIYDVRRPEVPCAIYDIGLRKNEGIVDFKFNPYLLDELFVHTTNHRVYSMKVNPVHLIGGRSLGDKPYGKWQVITFKHIDRGATATRHTIKRRELMPYEDQEIPLHDYFGQYEASKLDSEIPVPNNWRHPLKVDKNVFKKIKKIPEIDYESYLYKAVERVAADKDYTILKPKVFYEARGVETFDFVFPGVNGIMCFDRSSFTYKLVRSPKHYEGSINPYTGSDAVHFYRGLQIQEMIPAQTLTMMCNRLEAGWNAYQVTERSLLTLAYKLTEDSCNLWSHWLRNTAIMQYGGKEFSKIGQAGLQWKDLVQLPEGPLPVPEIPVYDYPKDNVAAEEICQMIAPFFRLFLPDPRPDLLEDSEPDTEKQNAPPPYGDVPLCDDGLPTNLSYNMRTLCKCHAKMRYYNKRQNERKYMYNSFGNTFLVGGSKRIREKFFKLGWQELSKPEILAHRLKMDTKIKKTKPINQLSNFQRFKAREFQKRVLPPKLITDSTSVLMKPEYIKEREQREKEMKEKASMPIQAPIGLSMPKLTKKEPVRAASIPDIADDDDPERARFLIRAAIQLADSSDDERVPIPTQATPTPPPPPPPSAAAAHIRGPQATSVRNANDDFEYETPEDAYFGIKKKRMYVVYQPATVPLGLRRYKPDRLRENVFVRRLEHLMYWGRRRHERDVLYGRYQENDKRQSSIKERTTLDLKLALNNHMKVGWQTFYDKNFFFSNKCSYNQILRKAIQMYNRMFEESKEHLPKTSVRHDSMIVGCNPRFLTDKPDMEEILDLRQSWTVIESPTIETYNRFMNHLQSKMPFHFGNNLFLEDFQGNCPIELPPVIPIEEKKQTAIYDLDESYMFPKGRLRFCEYDVPPHIMSQIEARRLPEPPKKLKVSYLEDTELPSCSKIDYSGLRRTKSSPDLSLDINTTNNDDFDDVILSNAIRRSMGHRFIDDYKEENEDMQYFNPQFYEPLADKVRYQLFETVPKGNVYVSSMVTQTKFIEWDSPMIADTDRKTGVKFMRRVVPFKEPQPPRQIDVIDPMFDYITIDALWYAARNLHVSYIINAPILRTWPGLQVLDEGRDYMFTLCSDPPRPPPRLFPPKFKSPLDAPKVDSEFHTDYFTENMLLGHHPSTYRARTPVYEEHSINIPHGLIEMLKPAFYGYYDFEFEDRYSVEQLIAMEQRIALEKAIKHRRFMILRQPLIEETEHELEFEENVNVEEDDLKTTSEESEVEQQPVVTPIPPEPVEEPEIESDDNETYGFWRLFEEPGSSRVQRKHGMFYTGDDEPVYTRFNPHTRTNMMRLSIDQLKIENPTRTIGPILNLSFDEDFIRGTKRGDFSYGSPQKSSLKISYHELAKQEKSVSWGSVTEHSVPIRSQKGYISDLRSSRQGSGDVINKGGRRVHSSDNFSKIKPIRKNSDPAVVSYKSNSRRSSLDQSHKREGTVSCTACIKEPWPTKETCIVCNPDTKIYRCTHISKLNIRCQVCRGYIYKFSCMNYAYYSKYKKPELVYLHKKKLRPVDEQLKAKLAVHSEPERALDLPAIWTVQNYKSGGECVDSLLSCVPDKSFSVSQSEYLCGFYRRDFNWVNWKMEEDKSEKVIVSEEFDVAFDRDADIDMMRDTMNTISQDGEMDMMTTYDQRTGMRIRRWISYAALATRVQKQSNKANTRRRIAERDARIVAGEIAVKPSVLHEVKRRVREKEDAAQKVTEQDDIKKEEEKQRLFKLWKKTPIPEFPEDSRKEMPNFGIPKTEDWLESSGSEDELPPIRSRMLSKELKEFIGTIKTHIENKPDNFDGLKVTYGKLFEKRPILKNDIVLVTKKVNLRRRPPPFRIQRIPLETTWLNSSLTVAFVPQPFESKQPKNALKWTVPFYSSKFQQLTEKETKDRTYRPPTPPLSIKKEYKHMKSKEKAFYYHKRVKARSSQKKAKIARQMRFRRKLYGRSKLFSIPPKAWTCAYQRVESLKSRPKRKVSSAPNLPRVPDCEKYIFSYAPKRASRQIRLSKREQSYPSSSSDVEYCPVVRIPRRRKKKKEYVRFPEKRASYFKNYAFGKGTSAELPEEERLPVRPVGLIDRMKKQLKRQTAPETYQKVTSILKRPESGHFARRGSAVDETASSSTKRRSRGVKKVKKETKTVKWDPNLPSETTSEDPIIADLEDKPIDNVTHQLTTSEEVPTIPLVETVDEGFKREPRSTKRKLTASSNALLDAMVEAAKRAAKKREKREQLKMKAAKYVTTRARSAPLPFKRKPFDVPTRRSFSVDTVDRRKKTDKMLRDKDKRDLHRQKRKAMKAARELERVRDAEKMSGGSSSQPAEEVSSEDPLNINDDVRSATHQHSENQSPVTTVIRKRVKKTRSIPVTKQLKTTLIESMSTAQLLESSRAKGSHTERPIQPRWLPTDHETDRNERKSSSHYRFQHMRNKRYTRKRKILHREPVKGRVLNFIRKLRFRREINYELKYKQPMRPKITGMFLNPWKPLPSWPQRMKQRPMLKKRRKAYLKRRKVRRARSKKPQPMSWKQMFKKLSDYKVSIKRIRLTDLKKSEEDNDSDSYQPDQKLLEIIVEPTYNLKSCMKKGEGRRSLMFLSQEPKEKENSFFGFNKNLRFVKPQTSTMSLVDRGESPSSSIVSSVGYKEGSVQKDAAKTYASATKYEHLDMKSTPSPVSARTTPSSPDSSDNEQSDDGDVSNFAPAPFTAPTPPPKLPADQQWRAAMMARRYMGASRPMPPPKPKETNEGPSNKGTGISPTPIKDVAASSESQLKRFSAEPSRSPAPLTAPSQLPRMAATKTRETKGYEQPVAKPKPTAPPPVTPVIASAPRKGVHSWYSDSSGEESNPNIPSTSGTTSGMGAQPLTPTTASKQTSSKVSPTQTSGPAVAEKKTPEAKPSTSSSTPRPAQSTPIDSFFTALFGRKKVKPLVVNTEEATPKEAVEDKTSPILPHIKKPETGQLMKRSPTSEAPKHPPIESDTTIVKFVGGKPIADLPPYNWAMSQRRRNKPASGSGSGSSSGSGSDNDETPRKKTSRATPASIPKRSSSLKPNTLANVNGEGTSSMTRSASSKTVRFGPTSYAPPKAPTPPPEPVVVTPKPPPRPEISFETLAEELEKEKREQEEQKRREKALEEAALVQQEEEVIPPTDDSKSKLTFFGLSPFGRIRSKKESTPPLPANKPSTSGTPASKNDPSTPPTSAATSTTKAQSPSSMKPESSVNTTDPAVSANRRPPKLNETSPLPKPAKPEPEQPPQLEVPKGVQKYDPVSQRKYYTRHGQEWKPRRRIPLNLPPLRPPPPREPEPEPEPLPAALPPPLVPAEKKKKRRKKKPEPPPETTLVLDGTEYFNKLTAENLKLLDREHGVKEKPMSSSICITDNDEEYIRPLTSKKLLAVVHTLIEEAKNVPIDAEVVTTKIMFHPKFNDSIITKKDTLKKKPKYETTSQKLRRMEKQRQDRITQSGLGSLSKRESAINAVRHVKKVKFFQTHKKHLMAPVASDYKPKSILKYPKPPVAWFYRVDWEGNKIYMNKLGPSEWQKKIDEKFNPTPINKMKKKKKPLSYLRSYVKVVGKKIKDQIRNSEPCDTDKAIPLPEFLRELPRFPKLSKDVKPENVMVSTPNFGILVPSRSLSSITVSSNASLNSLLDALTAVGSSPALATTPFEDLPQPEKRTTRRIRSVSENDGAEPKVTKQYPLVYIGTTVGRSPSTSASAVNLSEPEAYSSVAQDGSEIVEYVGQEETVAETVKRRFDPIVRPISALFKALGSSATEVGTEAGSRSRSTERTFGGLFRRSSPPMPDFQTRHLSESPTRQRVRLPLTSVSQGSSAEDILALMQAQPNALEQMEEIVIPKFPPLNLRGALRDGIPMWKPEMKIKNSLYNQIKKLKEESRQRKIIEYLDYHYSSKSKIEYSTLKSVATFDVKEYIKTNPYPRTPLTIETLGKNDPNSLRIFSNSRHRKASAIIFKRIKECQERFEKAKKLTKSKALNDNLDTSQSKMLKQAKQSSKSKKPRKIRALCKYQRTSIKYRVKVTIEKSALKLLKPGKKTTETTENKKKVKVLVAPKTSAKAVKTVKQAIQLKTKDDNIASDIEEDLENSKATDYDGDNDDDLIDEELEFMAATNPAIIRKNQRSKLLRKYFYFSVKMARKIARRSVGGKKPFLFYAFISKIRGRIRQFMDIQRKDKTVQRSKNKLRPTLDTNKNQKSRKVSDGRTKISKKTNKEPFFVRKALKYGNTTKKQIILDHSLFDFRKLNARMETFSECLDEYIDVGTPIKLVFRSKNTFLPVKMFDSGKKTMIDPVYYTTPTPCNTDSDFSDNTPINPKLIDTERFFEREGLESTYHVKGLPGLIYLARLVQERVGDDIERDIPFSGPGMETCGMVVYMTPIRRLMLSAIGLRMPDRLQHLAFSRYTNERFELWFGRLFEMLCYGRGDICKFIIDNIALGQGPPNKNYEKMDICYQAHIVHKLYKKMIYIENGKEARMAAQEFAKIGLDIKNFPEPSRNDNYDPMLYGFPRPWSREDWIEACDQFLSYSEIKESVVVMCKASLIVMRMIFSGGQTQDIIDQLITMQIPIRDKLLFIINLTPPDHLVENIVKIFHTVRGLDRLTFVGLGYHADPLRVLFEEATESGDPQLIAHFVRVGRCLDRRSREPMMTDCGSDHIQNRDFGNIMCKVFNNGKERRPYGAPTMDEMFPFRYVHHTDGNKVTESTEELAEIMEVEVSRYMAILELTKGHAVTKGDLDHNPRFNTYPNRYFVDVLCTGCKVNVSKARNLGKLGRTLCVSTMPLIEQDKDKKRWPNAKTMSPRLTFEAYIETLDPTENKMLMAKDIEEEKTDITVQVLPSRFGCFQCRFSLPRCCVCMCPYLNDHMDFALKEYNERFSQFSVCNICNHGGHVNHIAAWFETEKFCPVAGCDCKCQRPKNVRNLKGKLRRHMILSANMRAKSHLCNPECAMEADIDEGYLPDPDLNLMYE